MYRSCTAGADRFKSAVTTGNDTSSSIFCYTELLIQQYPVYIRPGPGAVSRRFRDFTSCLK